MMFMSSKSGEFSKFETSLVLLLLFTLASASSRGISRAPSFGGQQENLETRTLDLRTSRKQSFEVPWNFSSVGIEYLNHEVYGGLYAQMIFGESFEEAATSPRLEAHDSLLLSNPMKYTLREGYLTNGMDLQVAAVTFTEAEAWCSANDRCCGFTFEGSEQAPKTPLNMYFKMSCVFAAGLGWWSYTKPAPAMPLAQQGYIGCAGRSNSSALLSHVSEMWLGVVSEDAKGSFNLVAAPPPAPIPSIAFHGAQFQQFTFESGRGRVGVANHGLNCQHGMFVEAGRAYTGYTFLRTHTSDNRDVVEVVASLEDVATGQVLARQVLTVAVGDQWSKHSLNMLAGGGSTCRGVARPPWQEVSECSGLFLLATSQPNSTVDVDLTFLAPDAWGLVHAPHAGDLGLPARKDVADMFRKESLKVLRMGGSMCNHGPYRWKDFRGPREKRQPYHGDWYRQPGLVQSRGFGMFEMADLCTAINCTTIITVNDLETPDDMADFVEYCWGNATTKFGALRIADGHPEVYNITRIEIGNEVPDLIALTNHTVAIIQAMDRRSLAIAAPLFTFYIGYNIYDAQVMDLEANPGVEYMFNQTAFLGDRVFWDVHVGADPDSVARWELFFEHFGALADRLASRMRAVILEENGSDHGLLRGLGHAVYSNMMHRHARLAPVHGYANALEAWQGMDVEQSFPQGQVFTLPNMTWGQPTYWVIRMIAESYMPHLLQIPTEWQASGRNTLDVIALTNEDGSVVVVRAVNWGMSSSSISFNFHSSQPPKEYKVLVLQGQSGLPFEENTPGDPLRVSPKMNQQLFEEKSQILTVPMMAFVVATFRWEEVSQSALSSNLMHQVQIQQ